VYEPRSKKVYWWYSANKTLPGYPRAKEITEDGGPHQFGVYSIHPRVVTQTHLQRESHLPPPLRTGIEFLLSPANPLSPVVSDHGYGGGGTERITNSGKMCHFWRTPIGGKGGMSLTQVWCRLGKAVVAFRMTPDMVNDTGTSFRHHGFSGLDTRKTVINKGKI